MTESVATHQVTSLMSPGLAKQVEALSKESIRLFFSLPLPQMYSDDWRSAAVDIDGDSGEVACSR